MALKMLRGIFASDRTLFECRHCGETFDEATEECTSCGAEAVARYEL